VYLPKLPRRTGTTASRAQSPPAALTPSHARVLLVDDEPMVQRSVARLLRQSGYDVVVASDGLEALSKYVRAPKPQVVLLDLDMPGMDGETTCSKLLRVDGRARVIFVTGHDLEAFGPRLRALGALDTLAKPYSGEALIRAIEGALAALPSIPPDEDEPTLPH
jgi:CheY-like chemotaxis protein